LLQPQSVPRFNEDSALKKHWPLLWLGGLTALFVTGFALDFNNLGKIFNNQTAEKVKYETRISFPSRPYRYTYNDVIQLGRKNGEPYIFRHIDFNRAADRMADAALRTRIRPRTVSESAFNDSAIEVRQFVRWQVHRRLALELAEKQDFEAAEGQLQAALDSASELGRRYPATAISLGDLAVYNEMRAVQMQQVAQMLLRGVLPIFSFFAALLPFALFMSFIKSRDKVDTSGGESKNLAGRLFLKSMLLASWFGVVVTGWVALRNYGMGLAVGLSDPTALAFFGTLAALFVSCCLMLRYMPPVKSLSLKRSIVGFGFGGMLLVVKAAAIYLGLCFSLAGHPALKNTLFCESLYVNEAMIARSYAEQAKASAQETLGDMQYRQEELIAEMDDIRGRQPLSDVNFVLSDKLHTKLDNRLVDEVPVPNNNVVPYIRGTKITPLDAAVHRFAPLNMRNLTVGATVKACLAFLLLFYPECLAYILLGLKQTELALSTFNRAVRIKEYFLGIDHWLVVGTLELFGSCLLTFHRTDQLKAIGEDYLRQAIARYERSRGRHDELTIAAKMSLAHIHSERGDDKQAEKILLEALRDVGKDMDTLAYCNLLSVIGKLYCRRNNHSRAKQMYKQVIDLLEPKLAKAPSSKGWLGYLRNVYASTPTWQLELKLAQAYLDLAEVFNQAKYNGEAQRLTEDAGKRIGSFESELVVVLDVAAVYVRARLAQARILCEHNRYDECFKLLEAAKKQLGKWGYGRNALSFEFAVGECELGLIAGRGYSNYFELARKNYQEALLRFGPRYPQVNLRNNAELSLRWEKLGERFGLRPIGAYAVNPPALGLAVDLKDGTSNNSGAFSSAAAQKFLFGQELASADSWLIASQMPLATAGNSESKSSRALDPSQKDVAEVSQVIQESRVTQDEGIVIRWQREQKQQIAADRLQSGTESRKRMSLQP